MRVVTLERNNEKFDFNKIKKMAIKNGLKVSLKANGTLLEIKSPLNTWICPVRKKMMYNSKVIELTHYVNLGSIHFQNKFKDYKFMFESIKRHDKWKINKKGGSRVHDILLNIKNNNVEKWQIN